MTTPTVDPVDDNLRRLFTAIAESAPAAPDVSDIVRGPGLKVTPTDPHRGTVRWIASAAAVAIALGGGLVWSFRVEKHNDADHASSINTQPRLTTFLLPTSVPDGWQLVDITENDPGPNENTSPLRAWVIDQPGGTTRAVLTINGPVTFAGTTDTAATYVETDATIDPTQTSAPTPPPSMPGDPTGNEVGTWAKDAYRNQSQLYWQVDDFYIVLSVDSLDEATARAMQSELQISFSANTADLVTNDQSGYSIESDLGIIDTTPTPTATLVYSDADGKLIYVGIAETAAFDVSSLLDPTLDQSIAVAAVQPGADGAVIGSIERDGVTASFLSSSASNHTADEALQVLDSMVLVPESAWDNATEDITQRISTEPVIGSGSMLDGELTIHDGALLDGVCFSAADDTACQWQPPDVVGRDSGEFVSVDLLLGNRWVHLTRINDGASTDPIQIERMSGAAGYDCVSEQPGPQPDCGQGVIDRAVVSTDAGTYIVLSAPSGVDSLTVSAGDVDNRSLAEEQYTRPLR